MEHRRNAVARGPFDNANKIHLHKKGFALSLVLKVRAFVTQK